MNDMDIISNDAPYLRTFGLIEHPFRLAPNPKFAYRTRSTSEALAQGRTVIAGRLGLGCISGDIGTGKTTIAEIFAREAIEAGHAVASLYRIPGGPRQSEARILRGINRDLAIDMHERTTGERSLRKIEEYAYACAANKKALIVLIDEAHLIKPYGIGTILAMLGITSRTQPLIQIMLFGQSPEIIEAIKQDRALHARLAMHTKLEPLSDLDVANMVTHRLGAAGRVDQLFTFDAVSVLCDKARGIPRIVCTLAHRATMSAYERSALLVDAYDVELAAERLFHE